MRIVVHDFAGHPFQAQLSRGLAQRGHEVGHLWSPDVTTARGALSGRAGDPPSLAFDPVEIGREFDRYSPIRRLRDEASYAGSLRRLLVQGRPDVVLSANTPITAQARTRSWCATQGIGFVFWLQDVLSVGSADHLRRKLGPMGSFPAALLTATERRTLRRSDHVVAITAGFDHLLDEWSIAHGRRTVIENWTPLDEVPAGLRGNEWARSHGFGAKPIFMYAGTLGLKHDPAAILALAEGVRGRADVVVLSEGLGAEWLADRGGHLIPETLHLLPFQDWGDMPLVLASADVLLALLEPEAGVFSVPSKVLTSHAAGRAQLAAIPAENLAAQIITREGSGVVVSPGDRQAFVEAGIALVNDEPRRLAMGKAARAYAERAFDIEAITDRFEEILLRVAAEKRRA